MVNLHWALERMRRRYCRPPRVETAMNEPSDPRRRRAATCDAIGRHGVRLIRGSPPAAPASAPDDACNAGWLATCGAGCLAPVYAAQTEGIAVEVVVSETAAQPDLLTAWELRAAGVLTMLIADNAAGLLLMRHGSSRHHRRRPHRRQRDTANQVGTCPQGARRPRRRVPFHRRAALHARFRLRRRRHPDRGTAWRRQVLHVRGRTAGGAIRTRPRPRECAAPPTPFDLAPAALIAGRHRARRRPPGRTRRPRSKVR